MRSSNKLTINTWRTFTTPLPMLLTHHYALAPNKPMSQIPSFPHVSRAGPDGLMPHSCWSRYFSGSLTKLANFLSNRHQQSSGQSSMMHSFMAFKKVMVTWDQLLLVAPIDSWLSNFVWEPTSSRRLYQLLLLFKVREWNSFGIWSCNSYHSALHIPNKN